MRPSTRAALALLAGVLVGMIVALAAIGPTPGDRHPPQPTHQLP